MNWYKLYTHKYPVSGTDKTYTVKLTAYSGTTCLDFVTQTITVHGKPTVAFVSQAGICANAAARTITGASETPFIPGSFTYSGPGVSGNTFNPQTAAVGLNALQALYNTSFGCKDSMTQNINVWQLPIVGFTSSAVACVNGLIGFTDTSLAKTGNIKTWGWNFGDINATPSNPNTAVVKNPSHTYVSANTYTVKLTIINDSGCVQNASKNIVINPLPFVSFTIPASICLPDGNGTFTDASVIPPASGTPTYLWNFNDANNTTPSTIPVPTHQLSDISSYPVKLTVTLPSSGCAHDTTITLPAANIHAQPHAGFILDTANICLGDIIKATDTSKGSVVQSRWDFGDGNKPTGLLASNKYTSAGSFTVTHTIIDNYTCPSDVASHNVIVNSLPVVNAGPDKLILFGNTDYLSPVVTGNALNYKWVPSIPSAYLDYDTLANPLCTPLTDVTYKLTVTATGGCKNSDDMNVKVLHVPQIPNVFTPNGDLTNDFWEIGYLKDFPGATVEVYNRYGQLVFQKFNGYITPWDGKLNGQPLPVGTYYYIINPKNGLDKMVGSVTIIR